ncbi:hypothetical protein CFC21_034619 [Triticum aestivum]|uniref:Uncharacterized protein n=4 Tax=Triticum TaxID=4564 RepID=A0A9R0VGI0_TRITD|nr:hypothetical protein TRIUR3_14227 [Triticum urartu]KAF7021723.1 hypothetical protein CFC21_034619 [Triticum aestivum]VAH58821.1 unnamed protein product [Triticum turgidum subsp. durum]
MTQTRRKWDATADSSHNADLQVGGEDTLAEMSPKEEKGVDVVGEWWELVAGAGEGRGSEARRGDRRMPSGGGG